MNFIEQWFGISPDGGNGSFEANLIMFGLGLFFVLGLLYCFRKSNRIDQGDHGRS